MDKTQLKVFRALIVGVFSFSCFCVPEYEVKCTGAVHTHQLNIMTTFCCVLVSAENGAFIGCASHCFHPNKNCRYCRTTLPGGREKEMIFIVK